MWFGAEPSVLDSFSPEKEKARAEKQFSALLEDYRTVDEELRGLEKGKKSAEVSDIRHPFLASSERHRAATLARARFPRIELSRP